MTGLCKDCRYWRRNDGRYADNNFGTCKSGKVEGDDYQRTDVDGAFSGEEIVVGAEFGCIHFEARVSSISGTLQTPVDVMTDSVI